MKANEGAKGTGRWDRKVAAGVAIMLTTVLYGCTGAMVAGGLFGMEKYNVNQCLLRHNRRVPASSFRRARAARSRKRGGRQNSF